ncbi:helix-turn-helix domain-containing protein [Pseudonocardia eucalypti]|uniref:Helix-turn-helix domain-containing protein n=1 Tax=Pseudonocardia eucalypti TaxID=648755 RepID=A0ABP9RBC3_9PSEU
MRPAAGERVFRVERVAPGPDLAEFVDYYWLVRWRAPEPHRQQVVPQPRVHVAAEEGRLLVHGVNRGPFFRTLTGAGHVLGAAFHPGGFRPLLGRTVGAISGTVQPAHSVLGIDDEPVAARILGTADTSEMVAALEDCLLGVDPKPDATAREVTALVEEARRRGEITRVEQLAGHAGLSARGLQRLFTEYVGIGPKWIIQRFRILDAVAAAHSGHPIRWPDLAAHLGFSDQAHLTRVFTQVVGTPPATYQRDPGTT